MAIRLSKVEDILPQALDHRRRADQFLHHRGAIAQFAAQRATVECQAPRLRRAFGKVGHLIRVEGFFKEIERPDTHRLDSHRDIPMAGDHDDRQIAVQPHEPFEELHAIHPRHLDIAHHRPRIIGPQGLERILGAGKCFRVEPRQRQPLADRLAHVLLIIHDRNLHGLCHHRPHSAASMSSFRIGNCTSNTAPPPLTAFRAVRRPPKSFTIPEEIASPKPTPSPGCLVV